MPIKKRTAEFTVCVLLRVNHVDVRRVYVKVRKSMPTARLFAKVLKCTKWANHADVVVHYHTRGKGHDRPHVLPTGDGTTFADIAAHVVTRHRRTGVRELIVDLANAHVLTVQETSCRPHATTMRFRFRAPLPCDARRRRRWRRA